MCDLVELNSDRMTQKLPSSCPVPSPQSALCPREGVEFFTSTKRRLYGRLLSI